MRGSVYSLVQWDGDGYGWNMFVVKVGFES